MSMRKKVSHLKNEAGNKPPRRIVFLMQESCLTSDESRNASPVLMKLRHSKTGEGAMFMFTNGGQVVHEVVTFDEGHRSWFIGDSVQKDGVFHVATPVDPVYLILPYLIRASKLNKFMQLECILEDEQFPDQKKLSDCRLKDISCVSEVKGTDDYQVYRYDADRTLVWLREKVERVSTALRTSEVNVTNSAMVATFVRSSKYADSTEDEYTRYACGLVGEYLPAELLKQLEDSLGISSGSEGDGAKEPASKRSRLNTSSSIGPTDDYSIGQISSADKKVEKKTSAQKQLSKVDTKGMKNMSTFFTSSKAVVKK